MIIRFAIRRLGWAAALVALFATQPGNAQTPGPEAKLHSEIARIASESKGVVGVAAIHLPSDRRVEFNGDKPFEMASTLKLPLALYALHLGERGKIALNAPLPVQRDDLIEPGILFEHFRFPGLALSTLNAIELSVTVSDNGATDIIYSRVGGPRAVNRWLQSVGLGGINMGTKTVAQTFAGEDDAASESSLARTATPIEMAELLARLHRGRLLDKERTETILEVMKRTKGERISLQLPPGVAVRHKTGTLFGRNGLSVNDVGLIEQPAGGTIAIAVFIKDSPETVAHSTRDSVIGGISRAIYDYFVIAS